MHRCSFLKIFLEPFIFFVFYNQFLLTISNANLDVPQKYNPFWTVELKGGIYAAKKLARSYGLVFIGNILDDIYYFKKPGLPMRSSTKFKYTDHQLLKNKNVIWIAQEKILNRFKRDISVEDPEWNKMWYIKTDNLTPSMNVQTAWENGFTGHNVTVTVLDDGLEINHPDLIDNYSEEASYDFNDDDADPTPVSNFRTKSPNPHGTRCAGEIAAAANNSICGLGIAYNAKIGGIRMLDGDVTDIMEMKSLIFKNQIIDIYSSSWGPEDDGKTVEGPGLHAKQALVKGIKFGRGGLGSIFVWASGNGGHKDDCNCDGYTNSIYTLTVGSISRDKRRPWYAETCSSVLAVTYSSGDRNQKGVITTDLNHSCTDAHSGTSASAPLAAGICALALSANSNLTWRDLQYLVVYTSKSDGLDTVHWITNGAGRKFSFDFGYGLMDADLMSRKALGWPRLSEQNTCSEVYKINYNGIKVNNQKSIKLHMDGCVDVTRKLGASRKSVQFLEHVQAEITLQSDHRGAVELFLKSPMGTTSKLLSKRPSDVKKGYYYDWPFMTVHFWGERSNGTWTLIIKPNNATEVILKAYRLILYGLSEDPDVGERLSKAELYYKATNQLRKSTKTKNNSNPLDNPAILTTIIVMIFLI